MPSLGSSAPPGLQPVEGGLRPVAGPVRLDAAALGGLPPSLGPRPLRTQPGRLLPRAGQLEGELLDVVDEPVVPGSELGSGAAFLVGGPRRLLGGHGGLLERSSRLVDLPAQPFLGSAAGLLPAGHGAAAALVAGLGRLLGRALLAR